MVGSRANKATSHCGIKLQVKLIAEAYCSSRADLSFASSGRVPLQRG